MTINSIKLSLVRGTGGLNDEDIATAYILVDLYADLAVAKATYGSIAEFDKQAICDLLG
jgi:hypothetical protein